MYELGYHEKGNSFGTIKKGKYKAASDFRFDYIAEVICEDPQSSGFMVELSPETPPSEETNTCSARYGFCGHSLARKFALSCACLHRRGRVMG